MFIISNIFHHLSGMYIKYNPTQEDCSSIYIKHATIPIYTKNIQVSFSEQNWPPPKHFSKLVNNNTTLNLKGASYLLNISAFPRVSTWYTTGGTITKKIKHLGLTKHHWRKVEITWLMIISCKDMGVQYTGKFYKAIWYTLPFKKIGWTQYSFRCSGKRSFPGLHKPSD